MSINKILAVASYAGQIILESGGETYRVEETITRICSSYGLQDAESYVTPTGIICSASNENNDTISMVKRVTNRSVNLERIDLVNELSRTIEVNKIPVEKLKQELDIISKSPRYPNYIDVLFSAVAASGFTFLFGGDIKDVICSFMIGIVIKFTANLFDRLNINQFFVNSICGGISALMALIFMQFKLGSNLDTIIIGSIMLLVPGLSITNAIRDTIAGDLVSGLSRAADAFLVAVSIAVGTGSVLSLWMKYIGGRIL